MIKPDEPTIERLKSLSLVGKALNDTYSEENMDTGDDFFLAINGLDRFKAGIDQVELDEPTRQGLNDLIDYLRKKIDRRSGYVGSKKD